jgi:hypothetical protein
MASLFASATCTAERECESASAEDSTTKEANMNEYELSYLVPKSRAGLVKERVQAASEQNARDLVRARFGGNEVRIFSGRMTSFGGGKDERNDSKR